MTIPSKALSHTNRRSITYYLHQGETKSGKPRFFVAKTIRDGALAAMPDGYEFAESINGVVSVRRIQKSVIPEDDIGLVEKELARHRHIRFHRVETKKNMILIHEPTSGLLGTGLDDLSRFFGTSHAMTEKIVRDQQATVRYTPIMKFLIDRRGKTGNYAVYRMSYSGEGGWRFLSSGTLAELVEKYVLHIGTDAFYKLT